MRSEEETEKKVELLASVATALARYDFPVPGGPNSRMPLHGVRLPENTESRCHVDHMSSYYRVEQVVCSSHTAMYNEKNWTLI